MEFLKAAGTDKEKTGVVDTKESEKLEENTQRRLARGVLCYYVFGDYLTLKKKGKQESRCLPVGG